MNIKTRLWICTLAITCGVVGIALATPIVGLNFANILALGTNNTEVNTRARVALPPVVGQEQEDDEWSAKLLTY